MRSSRPFLRLVARVALRGATVAAFVAPFVPLIAHAAVGDDAASAPSAPSATSAAPSASALAIDGEAPVHALSPVHLVDASAPSLTAPVGSSTAGSAPNGSTAANLADASTDAGTPQLAPRADVRLKDRPVFPLSARGNVTAEQRASAASAALERSFDDKNELVVRVEPIDTGARIYVDAEAIVDLDAADARVAGSASVEAYADDVAGAVRTSLKAERRRAQIAGTVFSVSLLVFVGLLAYLALRRIGRLVALLRRWVRSQMGRVPGLTVGEIEVVSPTAARGALDAILGVAGRFLQLVILYTWAVFSLSLFDRTHDYASRITGLVVLPFSSMVSRLGGALPIVVIVVFATGVVALLVRFVGLFFGSVSRGETTVSWLPSELASATGALVRIAIVVLALLLGAPLLTGGSDDGIALLGRAAVGALALASVPLLATVCAGAVVIYGRRVRRGDRIQLGQGKSAHTGTVTGVTLLDVQMSDDAGGVFRVPHLATLVKPIRVGGVVRASMVISVARTLPADELRTVLAAGAAKAGSDVRVVMIAAEPHAVRFDVSCRPIGDGDLGVALLAALEAADARLAAGPT